MLALLLNRRWSLIAALALVPPLLAAPLCVVLLFPLVAALVGGFAVTFALGWWLSKQQPPPSLRRTKFLICAGVAFCACAALYSRTFSGLPAWIGSDSGNHAAILRSNYAYVYNGFVSMYLLWRLVEVTLRLNAFWSFVVVFYAQVTLLAVLPLAIVFAVLRPLEGTRAWKVGVAVAAFSVLAGLLLVALPLVHYFQVEGFWSQIFVLVPLVLLWWLDVTLAEGWQRVAAWAAAVVVVRYTYGLNLVELLIGFALVALLDAPRRLRLPAAAAAAVALGAAWVAHGRFAAVVKQWGWFVGYDITRAIGAGQLALLALLLAALVRPSELARAVRLPVVLAVGGFTVAIYHQHHFKPSYYIYKYPFQGICLLAVAAGVAVGVLVAAAVDPQQADRRRKRDLALGAAVLALSSWAFALWFGTFSEYHHGYVERLVGRTPHVLRPLADLGAWSRIDGTLHKDNKKLGGYLVSYGPMSNFMNSSMGVAEGQKFYFEGRAPQMGIGYCVFWDATQPDPWPEFNRWYRHRALAQRLNRDPAAKCEDYTAPWDATAKRRICHLCR